MRGLDIFAAIGVAIIWGLNVSIIKICVAEFPPIFATGFRFFLVAILLIWWQPPPWKQMRMIGVLSFIFGGIHFGGIFFGIRGVDVSIVSILVLMGVPFSVLFARILLKEHFSWKKICGMGIAFVGVVVLFGEPATTSSPKHLFVLIIAIVAWGLANTIIKKIGPINSFSLNAWMGLFSSVQLIFISLLIEEGQFAALQNASLKAWGSLVYIILLATIVGYGLWYYLVGKYDVTSIVPFTLLVPVIGVMGGILMMGEELTLAKVTGGIIVLTGAAIIQLRWQCPGKNKNLPAA